MVAVGDALVDIWSDAEAPGTGDAATTGCVTRELRRPVYYCGEPSRTTADHRLGAAVCTTAAPVRSLISGNQEPQRWIPLDE